MNFTDPSNITNPANPFNPVNPSNPIYYDVTSQPMTPGAFSMFLITVLVIVLAFAWADRQR